MAQSGHLTIAKEKTGWQNVCATDTVRTPSALANDRSVAVLAVRIAIIEKKIRLVAAPV